MITFVVNIAILSNPHTILKKPEEETEECSSCLENYHETELIQSSNINTKHTEFICNFCSTCIDDESFINLKTNNLIKSSKMENEKNESVEIVQTSYDMETLEASQRAEYDIQIATAKKYSRNLPRVKENCIAIIIMDKNTAESCRYALPRGGRSLTGPSVHLSQNYRTAIRQYSCGCKN